MEKVAAAAARAWHPVPREAAIAALAGAAIVFAGYTIHSVWVRPGWHRFCPQGFLQSWPLRHGYCLTFMCSVLWFS